MRNLRIAFIDYMNYDCEVYLIDTGKNRQNQ